MSSAIGYVGDEVEVFAFLSAQQTVNGFNHHFDDVNVLPLIEAADVVSFSNLALVENQVNSAGMVFNIEPVAHIFALAIYRQRLAVAYIIDEKRDEFFRELRRTVIVGSMRHDGGHAVGVVEGTHEVVAAGLARRIG